MKIYNKIKGNKTRKKRISANLWLFVESCLSIFMGQCKRNIESKLCATNTPYFSVALISK